MSFSKSRKGLWMVLMKLAQTAYTPCNISISNQMTKNITIGLIRFSHDNSDILLYLQQNITCIHKHNLTIIVIPRHKTYRRYETTAECTNTTTNKLRLELQCYWPVWVWCWQWEPLQFWGQVHLYWLIPSTQVPPFWQGLLAHSLTSVGIGEIVTITTARLVVYSRVYTSTAVWSSLYMLK